MDRVILAEKETARRPRTINGNLYKVDSSTATLVAYDVSRSEHGHWECNCMAAYYGRACKHVLAALAQEALTEAPELAEDLAEIAEYVEGGGPMPPPCPTFAGELEVITEIEDEVMPSWLVEDMAAIHEYLIDQERDARSYAFECDRVSNAQASWSWNDGEAA